MENYRSLLHKSPMKETIFYKRDLLYDILQKRPISNTFTI